MDEIENRLKQASESCIKHYEAWSKEQKSSDAREALRDAIHELRKVGARLEIEMAVSERDEMSAKPLPIPPHRSSRPHSGAHSSDDNNAGNSHVSRRPDRSSNKRSRPKRKMQSNKVQSNKSQSNNSEP